MIKGILFLIMSVLVNLNIAFSQISLGGRPLSDLMAVDASRQRFATKEFYLKEVNNLAEGNRASEIKRNCKDCKEFYGSGIDVQIDVKRDGMMTQLPDGKLWLLTVKSSSALGMQFYFSKYRLPKKASLFIYNDEDRSKMLGAFTHINNHKDQKFATQLISGKSITLEYFEADDNELEGELEIYKVIHAFKDIYNTERQTSDAEEQRVALGYNSAAPCTIDVTCDDGAPYKSIKKSVCRISVYDPVSNFAGYCSGFLINNLPGGPLPRMPYVLTAFHCLTDASTSFPLGDRFSEWIFEFDYEKPDCNSIFPPRAHSHQGAVPVTGGNDANDTDYLLLDLQTSYIEDWLDVTYAGWDIRPAVTRKGSVGIHHPQGDVKKISIDNSAPVGVFAYRDLGKWIDKGELSPKIVWKVSWDKGITENASSGSPLFDKDNKLAIGYLRVGGSNCAVPSQPDYYGSLWFAWNRYSQEFFSYSLKHYIDPNGSSQTLGSYDPSPDDTGGDGSTCTHYIYSGVGLAPTYKLGDFNDDPVDDCIGSDGWKVTIGSVKSGCTAYNAGNKYATFYGHYESNVKDSPEIAKRYNFVKDKEYIISLKVYSETVESNDDALVVRLTDNVTYGGTSYSGCNAPYIWKTVDETNDQVILRMEDDYIGVSTQNKFYTYAIRFKPKKDYQYLALTYYPFWASASIFVDAVYLYEEKDFGNLCVPNLVFSDPTKIRNTEVSGQSIVLVKNETSAPVISAGRSVTLKSQSILLKDGFKAENGSNFTATIGRCNLIDTPVDKPVGPFEKYRDVGFYRVGNPLDTIAAAEVFNYENKSNIYREDSLAISPRSGNENVDFIIMKNPFKTQTSVLFETEDDEIEYAVTDLLGREVLSGKTSRILQLNMSDYKAGLYIIRARMNGRFESKRFILTH